MPCTDDRACRGVPHRASDNGTACRTPSFASIKLSIRRTLAVGLRLLLVLRLLLLLLLGLLRGLGLCLG
jgi:hypothetical protein